MAESVEFSEIEKQHAKLKEDINRLRDAVTCRRKEVSDSRFRALVEHEVAQLGECLQHHFRLEEAGGYLEAVIAAHRGLGPNVARLREQHQEILAALKSIESAARSGVSLDDTIASVLGVLDLLREHEGAECGIMQDAVLDDLGTGD